MASLLFQRHRVYCCVGSVVPNVSEVEGDIPRIEGAAQRGRELRVLQRGRRSSLWRRTGRRREEVTPEGRPFGGAHFVDENPRQAPIAEVVVHARHGHRESQVPDIDHPRFPPVERVQEIGHADIVGLAPHDDLPAHFQVNALAKRSLQIDLIELGLLLARVEYLVGVIAPTSGRIGRVIVSSATDSGLPFPGQPQIEVQLHLAPQCRETPVIRLPFGRRVMGIVVAH